MMHTFCIDVSGSMSGNQMMHAVRKVYDEWECGDLAIIFDTCTAEIIEFEDIARCIFSLQSIYDFQKTLFKKGVRTKWRGDGAHKAASMAATYSMAICITDGLLAPKNLKLFGRIIKIENV
jgi:hypothetical protein